MGAHGDGGMLMGTEGCSQEGRDAGEVGGVLVGRNSWEQRDACGDEGMLPRMERCSWA